MALFCVKSGQLQTLKGVFECKNMLRESVDYEVIQSIFISQNRLVEGKDYKRAEYLKGTGGCYIDTLINPAWNDQLSATTEVSGQPTVINPALLRALGTNTDIGIVLGGLWYKNNVTQILAYQKVTGKNEYYEWDSFPASAEIYVSIKVINNTTPTVSCKIDGTSKNYGMKQGTNIITHLPNTTYKIGDAAANGLDVLNLKNIKINSHNLIPCQLLRSIPSTLDANGIARTAGECGMVDSISGKFYGNVASSGSFSVEGLDESGTVEDTRLHQIYRNKLVEGEDYMIGEQLATTVVGASADGGGYIGAMLKLPDDYLQFSAEFNLKKVSSKLNLEECVTFVAANKIGQGIARRYGNKHIMYLTTGSSVNILHDFGVIEGDMIIQVTESEVIVNGVSTARVASPNAPRCFIGMSNRALKYSNIIKVTQDDSRIFVPCRLLRPIPRNLDAQCKPRVAGECGMIDLISGRFYGNVASSGAFSLAWDEWLKDCSIQIAIPECYAFGYTTRVDTTKLTSELVDFGFIKLSNTQIVYGDEDDGVVYTVDWGTNKWATLNIIYNRGAVATILNGTTVRTAYNIILDQNPHIQLYDIMQIKQIDWSVMVDNIATTTTLTRYVNETTGQQGLISDQDGTIIYAD